MPFLTQPKTFETVMVCLVRAVVLMFSLSVHECAHGWMASRLGDDTALRSGRLTLNPLAHLTPIGGALIMLGAPVAWAKPVPVNPVNFDRKHSQKSGMFKVALSGPVSNIILAFISYFLRGVFFTVLNKTTSGSVGNTGSRIILVVQLLLEMMFVLNLNLAVFNLLPIPPLDGSKVLGFFLPDRINIKMYQYERYIGIGFLILVIFFPTTLWRIMGVIRWPLTFLIRWPLDRFFNLF